MINLGFNKGWESKASQTNTKNLTGNRKIDMQNKSVNIFLFWFLFFLLILVYKFYKPKQVEVKVSFTCTGVETGDWRCRKSVVGLIYLFLTRYSRGFTASSSLSHWLRPSCSVHSDVEFTGHMSPSRSHAQTHVLTLDICNTHTHTSRSHTHTHTPHTCHPQVSRIHQQMVWGTWRIWAREQACRVWPPCFLSGFSGFSVTAVMKSFESLTFAGFFCLLR